MEDGSSLGDQKPLQRPQTLFSYLTNLQGSFLPKQFKQGPEKN